MNAETEAALNQLNELLEAASKHAEYDLDIAVNRRTSEAHSARIGWTPSTSTATLRLNPPVMNAAARANAYAAAVEGNSRLAIEMAGRARAGGEGAVRALGHAADCAERIGHAASTCGSLDGAADIVYLGYSCAAALRDCAAG